jgi:hypothetical protein
MRSISMSCRISFYADREYKGHYMAFEVRRQYGRWLAPVYRRGRYTALHKIDPCYWQHQAAYTQVELRERASRQWHSDSTNSPHNVDSGVITIHSLNPIYPDKKLNLKEVVQLFNVVKIKRKL